MNLMKQIEERSNLFKNLYGIDILGFEQGSADWFKTKLGVISASNAYKVVSKGKGNQPSQTRKSYMLELCAQVATGVYEEVNSKHMEWGKTHEDAARSSYEFMFKKDVVEIPFIFRDDTFRCGVSVDGVVPVGDSGIPGEYKCPYNSIHYLDFVLNEKIKSEYQWQCQFGMWVTKTDMYHMCQFDPRMKKKGFHCIEVHRDNEAQDTLSLEVPRFIKEMDEILEELGFKFGDQWSRE